MRIKIALSDFDFGKIFRSGLFYFFYGDSPERKILIGNKPLKLDFIQKGSFLHIRSDTPLPAAEVKKIRERIKYCFGIDEDLGEFYSICRKDAVLKNYLRKIRKTRIFSAFTDFEADRKSVV